MPELSADEAPLWSPSSTTRSSSHVGRFVDAMRRAGLVQGDTYDDLWRWSVEDLPSFWTAIWDHFDVAGQRPADGPVLTGTLPDLRWFPGATVSYPAHILAAPVHDPAIIAVSQSRPVLRMTMRELRDQVARCRAALRRLGVAPGDRVAAYVPNVPETLVAFLATASLGAVWASCAPEFGERSVLDRFGQVEPKVLFAVDGYRYGEKSVHRTDAVEAIRSALPTVDHTVLVPYLDSGRNLPGSLSWSELLAEEGPSLDEEPPIQVAFDHPLYILFSSGTTGLPKPIVHGHGGILLEHLKVLSFHLDLGPGDRFTWYTTTGWMMWNLLVSGLAVGSSIVLFDGDPGFPGPEVLWQLVGDHRVTYLGLSAPAFVAHQKSGLVPSEVTDLSSLRGLGSTGAPLPAATARWLHEQLPAGVLIGSSSGGTDICSAFVGASPLVPVHADRIACRCLGAKVESFDADGRSVVGERGELVVTQPLPSMPIGFWGDEDRSRYRAAYFSTYPGVWRHGDWITITDDGGCRIEGRSDATLNRGGVRLGTAEIYAAVETLPEVADSLMVHLDDPEGGPGELLLLVALAGGSELDDDLRAVIRNRLRADLSPRHVPDDILAVRAVPTTLTGKKLEVPVKRILMGEDPSGLVSEGALRDPRALDDIVVLAAARKAMA